MIQVWDSGVGFKLGFRFGILVLESCLGFSSGFMFCIQVGVSGLLFR